MCLGLVEDCWCFLQQNILVFSLFRGDYFNGMTWKIHMILDYLSAFYDLCIIRIIPLQHDKIGLKDLL